MGRGQISLTVLGSVLAAVLSTAPLAAQGMNYADIADDLETGCRLTAIMKYQNGHVVGSGHFACADTPHTYRMDLALFRNARLVQTGYHADYGLDSGWWEIAVPCEGQQPYQLVVTLSYQPFGPHRTIEAKPGVGYLC